MNLLLSVILPVFNGGEYLRLAIESVLRQSFSNFEFIIINDGSTDDSMSIIDFYMKNDARIRCISRVNKGLVASLNEGLEAANGKYIARMDADDISLCDRFALQLRYLEKNPDCCVVGGRWS